MWPFFSSLTEKHPKTRLKKNRRAGWLLGLGLGFSRRRSWVFVVWFKKTPQK
jgi:hypothetical protein